MCSLFDPVDLLNVKNKTEYDSLTFKKTKSGEKPSINPKGNHNRLLLGCSGNEPGL